MSPVNMSGYLRELQPYLLLAKPIFLRPGEAHFYSAGSGAAALGEQPPVPHQVGDLEPGDAGLPKEKKFAGAAYF
jgi:hypothetical protein